MEEKIRAIIADSIADMGFDIVRIRLSGKERITLQIMADRLDETPITVDDCADISRVVSALLDIDDPIKDAYALEVSSPGIDRPLTRPRDFVRFAGFETKVMLEQAQAGRKRFSGILQGLDADDQIVLADGDITHRLPRRLVQTAKLVLTDALIAHSQKAAGGGAHDGGLVNLADSADTDEADTNENQ